MARRLGFHSGPLPTEPGTYTLFGAGNSVNLNGQNSGDRSSTTTLDVLVADAAADADATPTADLPTPTVTPTLAPVPCVGDCDGSGDVGVNELITRRQHRPRQRRDRRLPRFDVNANER